ncbi:MAG: DUF7768 domain-containing protein [Patescibacteria group bacterium]
MDIVYIAHPVGGDAKNLDKIKRIIRQINIEEPDVVPFAHYWVDCHALNDNIPAERARGIKNNKTFFERIDFDELRLYGNNISKGMLGEIVWAYLLDIPIKAMTSGTRDLLPAIISSLEAQGGSIKLKSI